MSSRKSRSRSRSRSPAARAQSRSRSRSRSRSDAVTTAADPTAAATTAAAPIVAAPIVVATTAAATTAASAPTAAASPTAAATTAVPIIDGQTTILVVHNEDGGADVYLLSPEVAIPKEVLEHYHDFPGIDDEKTEDTIATFLYTTLKKLAALKDGKVQNLGFHALKHFTNASLRLISIPAYA